MRSFKSRFYLGIAAAPDCGPPESEFRGLFWQSLRLIIRTGRPAAEPSKVDKNGLCKCWVKLKCPEWKRDNRSAMRCLKVGGADQNFRCCLVFSLGPPSHARQAFPGLAPQIQKHAGALRREGHPLPLLSKKPLSP